jgi:hypothetical protein
MVECRDWAGGERCGRESGNRKILPVRNVATYDNRQMFVHVPSSIEGTLSRSLFEEE